VTVSRAAVHGQTNGSSWKQTISGKSSFAPRYRPSLFFVPRPSGFLDSTACDRSVGSALYEGKLSGGYKDTEIIDLTNGRYDFYGGIVKEQPALAAAWKAPALTAIAQAELRVSWAPVGPGTLPTRAVQGDPGGMWRKFTPL
jgi:hypothetical protein